MEKKQANGVKKLFARGEVTVIIAVLILGVIFTVFSDSFFTAYNLFNMSRTAAIYIFIAIAQGLVVIVGGMNLRLYWRFDRCYCWLLYAGNGCLITSCDRYWNSCRNYRRCSQWSGDHDTETEFLCCNTGNFVYFSGTDQWYFSGIPV